MKISNIVEIFDNGEFVSLITLTGTAIHLPMKSKHSITIELPVDDDSVSSFIINVDLNQG